MGLFKKKKNEGSIETAHKEAETAKKEVPALNAEPVKTAEPDKSAEPAKKVKQAQKAKYRE